MMGLIKRQTENKSDGIEKRSRKRDFAGLINQLSSSSAKERRWAAKDLASYQEAARALLDRLEVEESASVREVIFSSLIQIKDDVAISGLVDLLRSEDVSLRNGAVEALREIGASVGPYVKKMLEDPDPDVRIFAINVMDSIDLPEIEEWLLNLIDREQNVNVCAVALEVLCNIGTDKSRDSIEKLKERFKDEPYIQYVADIALKNID